MITAIFAVFCARADDEQDLDPELELPSPNDGPAEVPHRVIGIAVLGGGVHAQTPLSGDLAFTLGVRPKPGLRIDAEIGSWLGTAFLPGTNRILPIAIPRVGAGLAHEASTRGAARPWVGAGLALAMASQDPLAAAPIVTARAGVDVGRSYLAWTVAVYGGVMVCPALPALAGPTYRAVAPVFGVQAGPGVRL